MKLFLTLLACWTLRRRYSYSKLSLKRSRNLLSRSLCVMLALFKASADTFDAKYCTTLRAKSELAARACRSLNSIQSVPSCEFSIIPTQALVSRMREFAFHNIIITYHSALLSGMWNGWNSFSYIVFFFQNQNKDFFTVKCAIVLGIFVRCGWRSLLFTVIHCYWGFAGPCCDFILNGRWGVFKAKQLIEQRSDFGRLLG